MDMVMTLHSHGSSSRLSDFLVSWVLTQGFVEKPVWSQSCQAQQDSTQRSWVSSNMLGHALFLKKVAQ